VLSGFCNISNDSRRCQEPGFVFYDLKTHFYWTVAICTGSYNGATTFFDDLFIQPHGSGPFSSLWWSSPPDISSVTFDHDVLFKLPSRFRGGG
jgi:hypothetical protein